jgi:hypothetical protein
MRRTSILALALVASLLTAGAALANPATATSTPAPIATDQALPAWLDAAPLGAHFTAVMKCEPPTRFYCVNQQCYCYNLTCAAKGVASFTCNEASHTSSCKCKP